jgi:glycosyltransferase involved in cell wall biosynthesis
MEEMWALHKLSPGNGRQCNMGKISVVIPTYNRAQLLGQSVLSVLNQTYGDFELIIVDDGSTDQTRTKVSEYQDSRVKYLYKENGGVSSARNSGIQHASGEYIGFLDSDDSWPEDYLDTMIRTLKKNRDYDLAYASVKKISKEGIITGGSKVSEMKSGLVTQSLFHRNFIPMSSTIFRTSSTRALLFDTQLASMEDLDFLLMFSLDHKIMFVDSVSLMHQDTSGSLSKSHTCSVYKAFVLERFYWMTVESGILNRDRARKRIANAYTRAGNKYYAVGAAKAAARLYGRSLRYNWASLKVYPRLAKSKCRSVFGSVDALEVDMMLDSQDLANTSPSQ